MNKNDEIVEAEIREDRKDKAVWAKAMALADGNELKASEKYFSLRVQKLKVDQEKTTGVEDETYSSKIPDGYISISEYSKQNNLTYVDVVNSVHLKQLDGVDIFGEWYIKEKQIQEENKINKSMDMKNGNSLKKSNYFTKHFNGKLPLWQSFWVNTVIVNLISAYMIIVLVPQVKLTTHHSLAFVFVAMWIFLIFLAPWQLIGLWRSAKNHIQKTKKSFFAAIALIFVVLNSINHVYTTATVLIPQIQEFSKIGLGKDDIPKYRISILRAGKELEIYGGIRFGLTKEIKKYFNKYPNIKVVHLNSFGGRISEAQKLSSFLSNKKLITYTSTGCYSACVDIYMAGDVRLINKNAYLGFHQPKFPGLSADDILLTINKSKKFYLSKGVSKSFLDKAYQIQSSDMWKPSHFELLEAGLITEVTTGSDMSTTEFNRWNNIIKLESDFLKLEIYQTIKTYYPETFKHLVKTAHTAILNGESKNEIFAKTRKVISAIYLKVLPYASDMALINAVEHMMVVSEIIKKESVIDCYSMLMEDGRVFDLTQYYTKDLLKKEFRIMSDIIKSEDKTKLIPSEKSIEGALEEVFEKLYTQYGDDVAILDQLGKENINKEIACEITISMYKVILKLPKSKSVKLLRFLFGSN